MSLRCLWLTWLLLTWLATTLCTTGCLLPYWLRGYVFLVRQSLDRMASTSLIPAVVRGKHSTVLSVEDKGIAGKEVPTDLGLFRRCGYPVYHSVAAGDRGLSLGQPSSSLYQFQPTQTTVVWRTSCGRYSHISDSPHVAWDIAFFATVTACALLFFTGFFLFLLGFAIRLLELRLVYRTCQVVQLIAGLLAVGACLIYPAGWQDNMETRQACGLQAGFFSLGRCRIGWAYVLTFSGGLLSLLTVFLSILFSPHRPIVSSGLDRRHHKNSEYPLSPNDCDLGLPERQNSPFCCACCYPLLSRTGYYEQGTPSKCSSFNSTDLNSNHVEFLPLRGLASQNAESLFGYQPRRPASVILMPNSHRISQPGKISPPESVYSASSRGLTRSPSVDADKPECIHLLPVDPITYNHRASQQSIHLLAPCQLPGQVASQYYLGPGYAPVRSAYQRYSTGALLGHFHPPSFGLFQSTSNGTANNMHTASTTVAAVIAHQPDPLIDVFEEEEDEEDGNADGTVGREGGSAQRQSGAPRNSIRRAAVDSNQEAVDRTAEEMDHQQPTSNGILDHQPGSTTDQHTATYRPDCPAARSRDNAFTTPRPDHRLASSLSPQQHRCGKSTHPSSPGSPCSFHTPPVPRQLANEATSHDDVTLLPRHGDPCVS